MAKRGSYAIEYVVGDKCGTQANVFAIQLLDDFDRQAAKNLKLLVELVIMRQLRGQPTRWVVVIDTQADLVARHEELEPVANRLRSAGTLNLSQPE